MFDSLPAHRDMANAIRVLSMDAAEELHQHFGITSDAIAAKARTLLTQGTTK